MIEFPGAESASTRATRRAMLQGLGASALTAVALRARGPVAGSLAGCVGSSDDVVKGIEHARTHRPRAKRVIYLHMAGGPSQHDLLDHKPALARYDGKKCPQELLEGQRFAFLKGHPTILASPFSFAQYGESGAWVSQLLPHFARVVDKVCIVRSMVTTEFNHAPAQLFLQTGAPRLGRPSLGAWVHYALGSDNRDLPGFVVLVSGGKNPSAGKSVWGSGFLPSVHAGVPFRDGKEPVLFLADPPGMARAARLRQVELAGALDRIQWERERHRAALARIEQRELSTRMQEAVPRVCDLRQEPDAIHDLYGTRESTGGFARNCLLARRLLESGVRFVQLYDWGWDSHGTSPSDDVLHQLQLKTRETDRPIAALLVDLEQRGMLEDTLVVWGGEFGRTPMNEARNGSRFLGRDHQGTAFTMWLAGGGVHAGYVHGETDDLGARVVSGAVEVHDLQATILQILGFDHELLTYRYAGRDFRLTDVAGRVVNELLA
ncbi:MAG: DUF1501 domain-containing protein [Planctomycetes bacterium]|nr:DUF1501 domain-containing protein [Planctomycetota bacterium]MCB9917258.1 DUF1501 domain-containing protein [Planctomycetota bacterium]